MRVTLSHVIEKRNEYCSRVYVQDFRGDDGSLYVQFIFYPKRWTEKHFLTVEGVDRALRVHETLKRYGYKFEYGTGYFHEFLKEVRA